MKLDRKQLMDISKQAKIYLTERELSYFENEINQTLEMFKPLERWEMHYDTIQYDH